MNKRILRADLLLLLTAGIWGFGFVAQRSGMEHTGPLAYNGIRFLIGAFSLLPLILIGKRRAGFRALFSKGNMLFSLAAGSCVFVATVLQQLGIMVTTAGSAGFITGFYVVLTPIFAIFLGQKTGRATWLGAAFAIAGLYFIAVADRIGALNPGDILVLASAAFWAVHVLLIDRLLSRGADAILLSCGQFVVCAALMLACAFVVEPALRPFVAAFSPALLDSGAFGWLPFPELLSGLASGSVAFPAQALIPILYGGICSVGIAYTLQVVAQKDAPPAHATIILCFEGSFAALGGFLILSEEFGPRALAGFSLMLAGMLVSQWALIAGKKRKG
ncbi:MAG: DMT family transporter [Treponema sp.]|nr:DMT family transporter [Treponema sp.]